MEGGGGGAVETPGVLAWGFGLPHVPQNRQSTSNFVPQAGQDPAMLRVRVGVYLRRWPANDWASAGVHGGEGALTPSPPLATQVVRERGSPVPPLAHPRPPFFPANSETNRKEDTPLPYWNTLLEVARVPSAIPRSQRVPLSGSVTFPQTAMEGPG